MNVHIGELISDVTAPVSSSNSGTPSGPDAAGSRSPSPAASMVLDEATIDLIVNRVLQRLRREWQE